jgi:hypothetical protein
MTPSNTFAAPPAEAGEAYPQGPRKQQKKVIYRAGGGNADVAKAPEQPTVAAVPFPGEINARRSDIPPAASGPARAAAAKARPGKNTARKKGLRRRLALLALLLLFSLLLALACFKIFAMLYGGAPGPANSSAYTETVPKIPRPFENAVSMFAGGHPSG